MALGDKRDTLNQDIHESIRCILGKHVKIIERRAVRLETKGDKTESRILVFTPCRLFVFVPKIPTKIDFNVHYLDLQAIESKKLSQLTLTTNDKVYSFHTQEELNQTSDSLITAIVTAISDLFPGIPIDQVVRRIEVSPVGRMENLSILIRGASSENELTIPCGNFSRQYACMCDYYGLPYREEVAWDVDTIYMSHNSKELNLRDFDHLDPKDLIPIISALELNSYFLQFRCSHLKLSHECAERLLAVLKKSSTLEEIYIDNAGFKGEFANKLSAAITSNSNSCIHGLDLSHNLIEDRGATHLSSMLTKAQRGLVRLSLSHCGLTGKGVAQIGHALSGNKFMASTLTYLDLSNNAAKDEINVICSFLAQPNVLTYLNLSNTDISLEPIFGALLRGGTTRLRHLDLSRNLFSTKKGKELPPSFKQYFTSALALRTIILAHCKITPEALKNLLLGLACNESIENVTLDLSNNILGNGGCHVLESCIHGVRCVSKLDISDNGIDVEMAGVLLSISRNKSLKKLILNKNFINMKSKHASAVIEAFVHLLQEEDCVIESLSLVDCKLKSELYSLINAVGSNLSLQHLDLNGNYMGDSGARLMSKALQVNTSLRTLSIDRNNISVHGYSDIAYALECNRTLRCLTYPLHDIMVAAKAGTDKVDILWKQIQESLQRNMLLSNTCLTEAPPPADPQQEAVINNAHKHLDRLVVQVNEAIVNLQRMGNESKMKDIEIARILMDDAHVAKQLLGKLHASVDTAQENISFNSALHPLADDIQTSLATHLQSVGDNLVRCAVGHCSSDMSSTSFTEHLKKSIENKSLIPVNVIKNTVLENTTLPLVNQFNELSMALCSQICDTIIEEVIQSLSLVYKSLVGDASFSLEKIRSSTPDVLKSRTRLSSELKVPECNEESRNTNLQSSRSPVATPQMAMKRKNLTSRKLRPKSVVGLIQGISADDIPDLVPPLNDATSQGDEIDVNEEERGLSVDELGESQADVSKSSAPLKHLGLSRPKKPKTRLPTRTAARLGNSQTASQESLDADADLSQGLDTFFHTTTMATNTGGSSVSLGSSRIRGSLGSVSSAELGSPSLESMSAESSPMHRSATCEKHGDEAGSSREELAIDEDKDKSKEKQKSEDDLVSAGKSDKRNGRGMGVRLLSSIFGKNPSPSPTGEGVSPPPAKSPVAKSRLNSFSKELPDAENRKSAGKSKSESESDLKQIDSEDSAASKRATPPSKIGGIGVTGTVLAEMKARQERRISGILKQNSDESQDVPERPEKMEPKSSLSPNPIAGVRLRSAQVSPEDPDLDKSIGRLNRTTGTEEAEPERNKSPNPITSVRLRPRINCEEPEFSAKPEDKCANSLNNYRLRATSTVTEDSDVSEKSESKPNPLSGVRLRSTGINVTNSSKPQGSSNGEVEPKNESRNSMTSKLRAPPPLAPKPRPWSIVGSDKKNDEAETADGTKENDAKEVIKPSKVRAMAASLNNTNNEVARRNHKAYLTDCEDQDGVLIESAEDAPVKGRVDEKDDHSCESTVEPPQQPSPPSVLFFNNFTLENAVDV